MCYRLSDVRTGRGKRGTWQRESKTLKIMGLFLINTLSTAASQPLITEGKLICIGPNNQSYICESGHCCGELQCCSFYYELWWFWLIWTVIIILSCCCVCHHRRAKHRLQQQQRQHEINLIAYREVHNYSSLPFYLRFLPSYLLPAYEEVENRPPTPPPPYSASQPGENPESVSPQQSDEICSSLQPSCTVPASESSSSGHCIEDTHHLPVHCPTGNANKPYLSFEEDSQQQQVASATTPDITKQSGDQGLDACPESKDKTPGRHRRFTGDSGIEVCVCSREPEEEDGEDHMKELEGLLDREGLQEQDFCDSCNPNSNGLQRSDNEELGFAGPERSPEHREPPIQRPPICLHLHTINEQEAHQHGNNAEPQN
ncbi:WW domain binding protein 1-like a [Trichomycterus rosablanca]|uniref:WW domain binding protein 1-like a n=1 Tax=Trichomycterus rosablanca TaxID=2290929 RepID=UPI002F350F2A